MLGIEHSNVVRVEKGKETKVRVFLENGVLVIRPINILHRGMSTLHPDRKLEKDLAQ